MSLPFSGGSSPWGREAEAGRVKEKEEGDNQEMEFLSITECEENAWQLNERRAMETRQEIDRIEQLGRVKVLLAQHIAAKIGRNLQAKVVHGPLGKEKSSQNLPTPPVQSPLTSPKPAKIPEPPPIRIESDSSSRVSDKKAKKHFMLPRKRGSVKRGWVVGRPNFGGMGLIFEKDQQKELEDIKEMQVVKNHLANRWRASHLANHMFNSRVNNKRTKTSILLTGTEPDQKVKMEALRNMNRFVIDKFLQTQSQNRRVLERLNSRQIRTISDIEVGKAKVRRRSDSSVHEAMVLEEAEQREKEEKRRGIKRPHKRASVSSLSSLLKTHDRKHTEKKIASLKKYWERGVRYARSKKDSASTYISNSISKHKEKRNKGSRRSRKQWMQKQKMVSYIDDDEALSKSSGTGEVELTTPTLSGPMLEPLFERSLPADQSKKNDAATSPLSSSGGMFLPYKQPPVVQPLTSTDRVESDHVTDVTKPAMPFSPPQSLPTSAPPPTQHSVAVFSPVLSPPLSHSSAPSTLKPIPPSPPPPPYQEHNLPSSLSLDKPSSSLDERSTLQLPINGGLAPSPSGDVTFDAITPAGYQADTDEYHDLSQEQTDFHTAPFSVHSSLTMVPSEDSLQETPSKRARIDDGRVSLNGAKDFGTYLCAQLPQPVAKSGPLEVADLFSKKHKGEASTCIVEHEFSIGGLSDVDKDLSGIGRVDMILQGESSTADHQFVRDGRRDNEEDESEGEMRKEKEPSSDHKTPSPSRLLSSKKSSSLENKSDSAHVSSSTSPRLKRHFSSPYISSANEPVFPRFKERSSATRNRAYYTPIEIDEEFNPFNYEFEHGESSEVVSMEGRVEDDSDVTVRAKPHPLQSSPHPRCSPSKSPRVTRLSSEVKRKRTIPSSVRDNPDFHQYVQTLSHEPTYDDYLAFRVVQRLVIIGDNIEERYKDKINIALDNIFMDIMKKTFSFEKFRYVASRLFFSARRMQERLFMIPLFARRLKEEVTPNMRSSVENYTEMFMDNFVTKYLMSIGGWENVVHSFDDIDVYDEHPNSYIGEGASVRVVAAGEGFVSQPLQQHAASNLDYLYDGNSEDQVQSSPFLYPNHNLNESGRSRYDLDTYEEAKLSAEDHRLRNENLLLVYLERHHPFLLEPGYLRRVNSVDVLFQDFSATSLEHGFSSEFVDCDEDSMPSAQPDEQTPTSNEQIRKRSSQMSFARSLSLDSLASPGLVGGAFCVSPTSSTNFNRRGSRSASRSPAPPVESPKKRAFPSQSPIHEHAGNQSAFPGSPFLPIEIVSGVPDRRNHTLPRPRTPLLVRPKPVHVPTPMPRPSALPHPSPVVHVPLSQNSFSSTTPPPSYEGQSSGDNYDSLYDSGPSRSNTDQSADSTNPRSTSSTKTNSNHANGSSVTSNSQVGSDLKMRKEGTSINAKTWVVPVAVVTIGAAAVLIASYYFLRRKS